MEKSGIEMPNFSEVKQRQGKNSYRKGSQKRDQEDEPPPKIDWKDRMKQ